MSIVDTCTTELYFIHIISGDDYQYKLKNGIPPIDYSVDKRIFVFPYMVDEYIGDIIDGSIRKSNMICMFPPYNECFRNMVQSHLGTEIPGKKHDWYPSNYYYKKKDGKYFSVRKIYGKALKVEVSNAYMRSIESFMPIWEGTPPIEYIDKHIPSFYIYLFYDFSIETIDKNFFSSSHKIHKLKKICIDNF